MISEPLHAHLIDSLKREFLFFNEDSGMRNEDW